MKDLVSKLPTLALTISRALNGGLERHLQDLRTFEKWLVDAHFAYAIPDQIIRLEESPQPNGTPTFVRFLLARQWVRKPTRVPMLIVESRIVLSDDVQIELVIQRSEENYLVLSTDSGFPPSSRRYAVTARLDTRHEDAFALALRRIGVHNGRTFIEPERITAFLHPIFEQL